MPWSETNEVEQRLQFVTEWKRGETSMSALCRVARYFEDGDEGGLLMLQNRSRAPMSRPHTTDARIEDLLIRARKLRPQYGTRKLHVWLSELGHRRLPAPSTIGEILTRHGV